MSARQFRSLFPVRKLDRSMLASARLHPSRPYSFSLALIFRFRSLVNRAACGKPHRKAVSFQSSNATSTSNGVGSPARGVGGLLLLLLLYIFLLSDICN